MTGVWRCASLSVPVQHAPYVLLGREDRPAGVHAEGAVACLAVWKYKGVRGIVVTVPCAQARSGVSLSGGIVKWVFVPRVFLASPDLPPCVSRRCPRRARSRNRHTLVRMAVCVSGGGAARAWGRPAWAVIVVPARNWQGRHALAFFSSSSRLQFVGASACVNSALLS